MKFSDLTRGSYYSFRVKSKNAPIVVYIKIVGANRKKKKVSYIAVVNDLFYNVTKEYIEGEDTVKLRKISKDLFYRKKSKAKAWEKA